MKRTFEMTAAEASKEVLSDFNWRDFEPDFIKMIREGHPDVTPEMKIELTEKEEQMDEIATLAREANKEFRIDQVAHAASIDMSVEEGLMTHGQGELVKKQAGKNMLVRMIAWAKEQGIISNEEAYALKQWYEPKGY